MALVRFWKAIEDSGDVLVSTAVIADQAELSALSDELVAAEENRRRDLAGTVPTFHPPTAIWATLLLYKVCQHLAFPELPVDAAEFSAIPPYFEHQASNPSRETTAYSADLAFQVLPDLFRLSNVALPKDVVTEAVIKLAVAHPLSSVGIAGLTDLDITGFWNDPCLRQLYLDRIVSTNDLSRLRDPVVLSALKQTAGAYPHLVKVLSLEPSSTPLLSPTP